MKRAMFLLLFALVACKSGETPDATKSKLVWFEDWNAAVAEARKENRNVIVEFSTEWCPYCEYVHERIFNRPEVAERMKGFVLLHMDGDAAKNQAMMDKNGVFGFPTFVIFDSRQRELSRFNDIKSAADFMGLLDDLERKRPVARELTRAESLEMDGKDENARSIYRAVYRELKGTSDPILEGALAGLMRTSRKDRDASLEYAAELIETFPHSANLSAYYKHVSDLYESEEIKRGLLKKAADIITKNLDHPDELDDDTARITVDQHVDLLADVYRQMDKFDEIPDVYVKGARVSESLIDRNGGLAKNKHMISTVAYYYQKAGEPERAVSFLKGALSKLPDYWPVYSGLAKAYLDQGRMDEALVHAEKGYGLAKEVAKSKLALLIAEIHAASGNHWEAVSVLEKADEELKEMGNKDSGRAARMSKKLEAMIEEYKKPPKF